MNHTAGSGAMRGGRVLVRLGLMLLVLAAGVVFVRAFVADVYLVDGHSMAPVLLGPAEGGGGEAVLVQHDPGAALERWELVVLLAADERRRVVKRVAGLPGERVQVPEGDLLVDGRRLEASAARPAPVTVFDQGLHDVAAHFHFMGTPDGPWTAEEGGAVWRLDARDVPLFAARGMMLFRDDLTDSWVAPDGRIVHGRVQVNDGLLECEVMIDDPAGRVRLWLVEQGDTFEAVLTPREGGRAHAQLLRRNPQTTSRSAQGPTDLGPVPFFDLLDECEVDLSPRTWHHLRLVNVDNHVALDVDGRPALYHRYSSNVPLEGPRAIPGKSIGARAALGGEGGAARFRGIRVLRDLFWVPVGEHGVEEAIPLGPDEYFVLGDNSADSNDSRQFGPVPASRILGRPLRVIWPLGRARGLPGAEPLLEAPDPAGTARGEPGSSSAGGPMENPR